MVSEMSIWLPDVPVLCEPAIMDRWTKDAESTLQEGVWSVYWYEAEQLRKAGNEDAAGIITKRNNARIVR